MAVDVQPTVDTGNPGLNSLIRSGIIFISALITGGILTRITPWLDKHGWTEGITIAGQTIDPAILIGGVVFSLVAGIAAVVWGYLRGTNIGKMIAGARLEGVQAGIAVQAATTATAPAVNVATHDDAAVVVGAYRAASPPAVTADDLNAAQLNSIRGRTT